MWFDASLVETISSVPTWVAVCLLLVSFFGSVYVVVPGVVVAHLFDRSRATVTWPGIVIGGYGIFITLKPLFSIDRPPVDAPLAREAFPTLLVPLYDLGIGFASASFPSGHAIAATVFWGLVAIDCSAGSRRTRIALSAVVVTLVGLSRIVLGVHYPADVLGGVAIGAVYLAGALSLRDRVSNPATTMLLVGGLFAAGGLVSGRRTDALLLLSAATITGLYVWYHHESAITAPTPH